MQKNRLKKYADLIAGIGINVQRGQEVDIHAGLEQPEFVKMLAEACYRRGAKRVNIEWSYQPLEKVHNRYRSVKTMSELPDVDRARWERRVKLLPCEISLLSDDPAGLKGLNMKKIRAAKKVLNPILNPYRDAMEGKNQWCVAAVPGEAWARTLFPGMRTAAAVEKLWEAILTAARVDDDPVAAWERHGAELRSRCDYMNALGLTALHYTAGNGTDLTVGLIEGAEFQGCTAKSPSGLVYYPNIPSEECFITPKKGRADGIVYSSMPLSYAGQVIENFSIRFENGKAVEWHAEKNEAVLGEIIGTDEGSCYLGECALVPFDSPIARTGILFLNTLFDENAACHLALGRGYGDSIPGYEKMSIEQLRELGVNESCTHVDFMIGTGDFCVDGLCADGRTVPLFRAGHWAF